jgi:CheY-like chemotaxis protein
MNPDVQARVLIVDDSPEMLMSMRDVLELEGTVVATATSSADADRVLSGGFDPNVIIVDLLLASGERGDEYARALRARYPGVRVTLTSGDMRELRRLEREVDATLAKPFHVEQLLDVCSRM